MSTQQTKGSNGTTQTKPAATEKTVETTVTLPAKKEDEKSKPSVAGVTINNGSMPVEDRIYKVNQLSDLVERHSTLIESQSKLNSFKLSSDGNKDTLTIRDSKGREFSTTNSTAIADVLETLKTSTAKKIADTEKQIVF